MTLFWIVFILSFTALENQIVLAQVGVCYGMVANNLPPATDVVQLYQRYGITKMRLYDPDHAALEALRGSQIAVTLGIRNDDLPGLAADPAAVASWIGTNMDPYFNDVLFEYVGVGNEVIPGPLGWYVLPVIQSFQTILNQRGLDHIKVTTAVPGSVLGASYPPSAGAFSPESAQTMGDIVRLLSAQGSPLLVNVYPYFAFATDPADISLDYALFQSPGVVVWDGNLGYSNLFDAIVDALYSALEKEGVPNVRLVVSESGWPSAGNGAYTTPALAATYNQNYARHILQNVGTPKRPNVPIEGFIFALFNENQKPAGVEQNWGLFYPDMTPVYPVF